MATEMQLFTLASLLRRGKALDGLSNAVSLLGLAIGLAPLLGAAAQPLSAVLCALLLLLGWSKSIGRCASPWMPNCSSAWRTTPNTWRCAPSISIKRSPG